MPKFLTIVHFLIEADTPLSAAAKLDDLLGVDSMADAGVEIDYIEPVTQIAPECRWCGLELHPEGGVLIDSRGSGVCVVRERQQRVIGTAPRHQPSV